MNLIGQFFLVGSPGVLSDGPHGYFFFTIKLCQHKRILVTLFLSGLLQPRLQQIFSYAVVIVTTPRHELIFHFISVGTGVSIKVGDKSLT